MRKSYAERKGNRQENHRFITESRGANLVPNGIGKEVKKARSLSTPDGASEGKTDRPP
jgi:hypothetical protein